MHWMVSSSVRKNPAPEGALRHHLDDALDGLVIRQKEPSTRRRIKTSVTTTHQSRGSCQKALSTRRYIKTETSVLVVVDHLGVRKHPAPEGALRPVPDDAVGTHSVCQKAPSTRRCIKTQQPGPPVAHGSVRKHPAPEGALRHDSRSGLIGSGQGQKAPSTRRCIKTLFRRAVPAGIFMSESTQHHKVH